MRALEHRRPGGTTGLAKRPTGALDSFPPLVRRMELMPRPYFALPVWLAVVLASQLALAPVAGAADEHWVATWAAAPQQPPTGRGGRGGPAPTAGAPA